MPEEQRNNKNKYIYLIIGIVLIGFGIYTLLSMPPKITLDELIAPHVLSDITTVSARSADSEEILLDQDAMETWLDLLSDTKFAVKGPYEQPLTGDLLHVSLAGTADETPFTVTIIFSNDRAVYYNQEKYTVSSDTLYAYLLDCMGL